MLSRLYMPVIRMLIGPDRALVTEVNILTVTTWKHCCREQLQGAQTKEVGVRKEGDWDVYSSLQLSASHI